MPIGFIIFILLSAFFIIGGKLRWKCLVDPPESLSFLYMQFHIRKLFGETGAVYFAYFYGFISAMIALIIYFS